jgi:glycosyltransferase involved in cell wall biosynthesis
MKVFCVIPAFNEEKTVRKIVERALLYVNEVVVVDDGSDDGTYEEAISGGATVIKQEHNCGAGKAIRIGVEKALNANADLIVTLDADGEHDPDDIPRLVHGVTEKNANIVVGSRFLDQRMHAYKMPILNKISNKISTSLMNSVFKTHITDSQSGFRVYTRNVFEQVNCEEDKYLYLTEVLIKAIQKGLIVAEIPITSVYRRDKKLRHSLKESFQYTALLYRIKHGK